MKNDQKFFCMAAHCPILMRKTASGHIFPPLLYMQKRACPQTMSDPTVRLKCTVFVKIALVKILYFFPDFFSKQACISRLLEREMLY